MRTWFMSGLLLTGFFLAITAGTLAQTPPPPPPKIVVKEAPPPKLETRVYRLQHCDVDEIRNVLEQLLEAPLDAGGPPWLPGAEILPQPMPGGMLGMMGGLNLGGFGMVGGGGLSAAPWRVSVNPRSGTVIVRGRPLDLQLASDLVAVLDLPEGKPLPKVKTVRAIPLKHAEASELSAIIIELEIPVRVVALDEAKMIVGAGPEEALAELTKVIKELDLPERKLDEKNMKRLGVGGGGAV